MTVRSVHMCTCFRRRHHPALLTRAWAMLRLRGMAGAIIVSLHPLYRARRSTANIIIERPSRQYGSPCDAFSTSNLYYLVVGNGDAAAATAARLRRRTTFEASEGWRLPGILLYR